MTPELDPTRTQVPLDAVQPAESPQESPAGGPRARTSRSTLLLGAVTVLAVAVAGWLLVERATPTPTAAEIPTAEWVAPAPSPSAKAILADPAAALPTGVNGATATDPKSPFAWMHNTFNSNVPTVTVWEDFQCPACAAFERTDAAAWLTEQSTLGTINLQHRPTAFLDFALRNDSSVRATAVWGCAIDAGVGDMYRQLVFANQPETEGTGFTDTALLSGGALAGLTGDDLDAFNACVAADTYITWAGTSSASAPKTITGTPTVMINGTVLDLEQAWDAATLQAAVDAAR